MPRVRAIRARCAFARESSCACPSAGGKRMYVTRLSVSPSASADVKRLLLKRSGIICTCADHAQL
eukprot:848411-Pleurochrysis_carterae.AAC.2